MVRLGRVVWPGPVGIGAGITKGSAVFLDYASKADSVEVGSITRERCHGNEGQTIWRTEDRKSLRHNSGIPNPGAVEIVHQLKEAQNLVKVPWGLSVAVTPGIVDSNLAAEDLKETIRVIFDGGLKPTWLTFNVSSPDTKDRTELLMEPNRVNTCLQALMVVALHQGTPVWLKLGPLKDQQQVAELLKVAVYAGVEVVQISNAMPDSKGLRGGWGGEVIRQSALRWVKFVRQMLPTMPIVALGGITTGKNAEDAFQAGAQAVQVVSAMLIRGREAAKLIRREWEEANKLD